MYGKPLIWWLGLAICLAALGIAVPLYAGFLGEVHPGFDSISHFRMHLAAGIALLAACLLFVRGWRLGVPLLLLIAAAPVAMTLGVPQFAAGAQAGDLPGNVAHYRFLHLNLRYDNPEPEAVLSLIGREKPDVISLVEVSRRLEPRLEPLAAAYPYRVRCPANTRNGGVMLLSRRPFAEGGKQECRDRGSLAIGTFDFGGRAVDVASLHLAWPWPFGQDWQVGQVTPYLSGMSDTAIMAGDFNATPWSVMARRLATDSGFHFTRWVGPTWLDRRLPVALKGWIGLPIDHVLVKDGITASPPVRLGYAGSDHFPVLTEFSVKAPAPQTMRAGL